MSVEKLQPEEANPLCHIGWFQIIKCSLELDGLLLQKKSAEKLAETRKSLDGRF